MFTCMNIRTSRFEKNATHCRKQQSLTHQTVAFLARNPGNPCEIHLLSLSAGERGGSVVECRTPEREVGGSKPTAAMLCP